LILTARELEQHDHQYGFRPPIGAHRFGAPSYRLAKREWVERDFIPAYRRWVVALGLRKWRAHVWDCNLYTDLAATLAAIFHAATPDAGDTQLAVGRCWYKHPGRGGYHASALFTCEGLLPLLFEGDTLELRIATRDEAESCDLLNR
jgi:hypothetical protein